MNLWPDYTSRQLWEAGVDPDFDGFDGELTFAQMCNPQFDLYGSPKPAPSSRYSPQRYLVKKERNRVAKELERVRIGRQPRGENYPCRWCIPYNGHHTGNYWGTGQKDIW